MLLPEFVENLIILHHFVVFNAIYVRNECDFCYAQHIINFPSTLGYYYTSKLYSSGRVKQVYPEVF